jgi:uncharacterized membrane protein
MSETTKQHSRHVSVPSDQGIRVDKSTIIHRPVAEVYSFWRKLENLPRFMRHLESVEVRDDLHSHWVARAVGEKTVAWDAEIIERRENEMISWRSTPGSEVEHAGSVWFKPLLDGQGTEIRVELKYLPPAGKGGALFARIFGRDAGTEIEEDLNRLKALLETGQLPPEPKAREWQRRVLENSRKAAGSAHVYVHENPWPVIGSVAALFFVLGLVVGLSRD